MTTDSKSFQNCVETDVPGYNDCPSFLFQISSKKGGSSASLSSSSTYSGTNLLKTKVRDVSGNTKLAVAPPPMAAKRKVSTPVVVQSDGEKDVSAALSKEEIEAKVNDLYAMETKLPSKEFEFYKKKVSTNIVLGLKNESTVRTLSQFFDLFASDRSAAKKLVTDWMIADTSIGTWCPAFLKIIDNII